MENALWINVEKLKDAVDEKGQGKQDDVFQHAPPGQVSSHGLAALLVANAKFFTATAL